jgi:hypothetical protein
LQATEQGLFYKVLQFTFVIKDNVTAQLSLSWEIPAHTPKETLKALSGNLGSLLLVFSVILTQQEEKYVNIW